MKKVIGLIVVAILLVATGAIGVFTGNFSSFADTGLHFDTKAILSAIIAVLALIFVEKVLVLIMTSIKPKNHRAHTVLTIVSSMLKYIFGLIAVCAVLAAFGADVQTVVAGVGILALVIGFGAESLIADMITGMFILFENQYNVGDIIEVNGFRGTVSDVGIRITCVMDPGGNILIINNSNMKNVLNRSDNKSRAVSVFPIPYETDLEALEEKIPALLEEIQKKRSDIFPEVPIYLGVDALADSSVNLKFIAEVEEKNIFSGARTLNHDLYVGMKKLGIEVPFPQVDVHNK